MKCALIYVEHRFCTLMHPLDRCYVTQLTLDDLIMRIKKRPLAMRYQLFFFVVQCTGLVSSNIQFTNSLDSETQRMLNFLNVL